MLIAISFRIHLRLNKLEFRVETSRAVLEPLLSASYYLVEVKATNQFTESFSANLYKFTSKLMFYVH